MYEDTDGDEITSELDTTLKRNNAEEEWSSFVQNLREIIGVWREIRIVLKKMDPEPKNNGNKDILLKVSEKRQKWV